MNRSLTRTRTMTVVLAASGLAVAGLVTGGPAFARGSDDAAETGDDVNHDQGDDNGNDDVNHDQGDDNGNDDGTDDHGHHSGRHNHVTVCVTAPGGGSAPARTRIIAVSIHKKTTERSVRRIHSNGCATVAHVETGKVRIRAVGVSSDDGTTTVYRAVWPARRAATLDDSDVLRKELVLVRSTTRG